MDVCFHCGEPSVIWDSDFTFEDYGLEGPGIIHALHCSNCGAYIQYEVPTDWKEDNEERDSNE